MKGTRPLDIKKSVKCPASLTALLRYATAHCLCLVLALVEEYRNC